MQKQPAQRGPINNLTMTCYFIQKHPAGLATYFVLIEHLFTPDRDFSGRGAGTYFTLARQESSLT
jgi:hypothetical protein